MNLKIYKSKIGMGILIPVILLMGTVAALMAINGLWFIFSFLVILLCFIVYSFFTITYAIIDNKELKIKYSFLFETTIAINTITVIAETNNPISSPAASLDRIAIKYKNGSVIISPKNKTVFIEELLSINPSIIVKLKKCSSVNWSH